jgi:hypothetical protein
MAVAGVNGTGRELLTTDAGPVDKVSITDAKTGDKGAVYFNLSAIMIGTATQKAKPKP